LPFLIKSKYFPWVVLLLIALLTTQFFCFVASGIVGYYQELYRKEMVIKLPLWVYRKIESWLPNALKERDDFVKIDRVQSQLELLCRKGSSERSSASDEQNARRNQRPFERQV
jgi:hypothetical protein